MGHPRQPRRAEGDRSPGFDQYLQMLPQIAHGNSNKVWPIPTEFSHALAHFDAEFANADSNGKARLPTVPQDLAG